MTDRPPPPAQSADPAEVAGRLRRWLVERALPLWSTQGYDRNRGGFQERLHPDGTPDLLAPRRLRVQARQVYVYAHAAALGWFPDAQRLMTEGAAFMVERYRAPDGRPGYVFSLAPDGGIADAFRSTYDHMFVVLALAWAAKVSGDAQLRSELDEVLSFVDGQFTATDGSFLEGDPPALPRRQNPHMHAFEAMLALHETVGHPQALRRADVLLALMESKFFDPATGTLGEYFTDAWEPAPGLDGRRIEPGHHAEWAWLLRKNERLRGLLPGPLAATLLRTALRSTDAGTGLLIDEAGRDGAPLKTSRRAWPQAELAKAFTAEAEIGVPDAASRAAAALERLEVHFLDHIAGGWTDHIDQAGRPLTATMPATTLYHLFEAIAEAHRVFGVGR